jgi:two-component system, NarL family, response regulator DevR
LTDDHVVEVDRNGLEVLSRDACLRLLATATLGRVGVSVDALPRVLPVNFRFDGGRILIRTGTGTKLDAAADNAVVAFEVDEIDPVAHTGWSVVVTGMARELTDAGELGGGPGPAARPLGTGKRPPSDRHLDRPGIGAADRARADGARPGGRAMMVAAAPTWRTRPRGTNVTIRVFLLDDHEVVRRGVRDLLEAQSDGEIEVAGEAGTAEEAYRRIPAVGPDVAILDVRLPDGDGVEVCREIRSRHPEVQCLMLTSFADDEALFDSIMAGAAGYVLKQVRGSDLVDSVRRVAAGQSLLDPTVTAKVLDRLRMGPEADPVVAQLTEQERKILDLLAEGLTNRQIGERLYLAEKTVKNYVSNLLLKLGMHRRTEAAVYAARLAERRKRPLN